MLDCTLSQSLVNQIGAHGYKILRGHMPEIEGVFVWVIVPQMRLVYLHDALTPTDEVKHLQQITSKLDEWKREEREPVGGTVL